MASKSHHPKLKPLFSCSIFRHCTHSPLSPSNTPPLTPNPNQPSSSAVPPPTTDITTTITNNPPSPLTDPPPPSTSSSSSSSSSASQSFTQWRFPLQHPTTSDLLPPAPLDSFQLADLHFSSGNSITALRLLERFLASQDPSTTPICPLSTLSSIVRYVLDPSTSRPASKVLLAVLLPVPNRLPAVEAGAVAAAVEAVMLSLGSSPTTAERALAALELMCTVPEGAAEVRARSEAGAALCGSVEKMVGRGRECALGVLTAAYGGAWAATAPEQVGRAVAAALQGECSARGRRKGLLLLKALREAGRLEEME